MSNKKTNKVKFGLKNVHYAPIESFDERTRKYNYATPMRIPGAVNLVLNAQGESSSFFADDIDYYNQFGNSGYEGDLEIALIPNHFRMNILGDTMDTNGVITENSDAKTKEYALMFEFDGDVSARRHVLFRCSSSRPNVEGETKTDMVTPKTETISIKAVAHEGTHNIKSFMDYDEDHKEVYESWYDSVYEPTDPVPVLGVLTVNSAAGTESGNTKLTVTPAKGDSNSYYYKTHATAAPSVEYGQDVSSWNSWDGSDDITATDGHKITVVEADGEHKAVKAGSTTVVSAT